MLNRLDDYPIHQTREPLAHPADASRNVYDRYFFHGYARDASLYFAVALGVYPNRGVMDAAFSVVRRGEQVSVHASRRAPVERTETRVGPLSIDVLEPMRRLRVRVAPNPSGIEAELLFRARTEALEEPRQIRRHEGRVFMDATRFTQWGGWEGNLRCDGDSLALTPETHPGARDRSWGVRPVGEPEGGAPGAPAQVFFLWSPVHFGRFCTHVGLFEESSGRPWHAHAAVVPALGDGAPMEADPVGKRVRWRPGTRRVAEAALELVTREGSKLEIALEPLLDFQMLGIGYLNPEWGHGVWKGDEAVGASRWKSADLDPLDPRHVHVQQLCRARLRGMGGDGEEGIGVLEQLAIGPHAPSGFEGLFDGAR